MIEKLYMYGIREKELLWFKSYLTNQKQVTKVNGITSREIDNEFGIHQGSILGALLFIIYVNDMPNILEKCKIVLYAGDTNEEYTDNLTYDVKKINDWLKIKKFKLDEKKRN